MLARLLGVGYPRPSALMKKEDNALMSAKNPRAKAVKKTAAQKQLTAREVRQEIKRLERHIIAIRPRDPQDNVGLMASLYHATMKMTPYFVGNDDARQSLRERCGENAPRYRDALYEAFQVVGTEEQYQAFVEYRNKASKQEK